MGPWFLGSWSWSLVEYGDLVLGAVGQELVGVLAREVVTLLRDLLELGHLCYNIRDRVGVGVRVRVRVRVRGSAYPRRSSRTRRPLFYMIRVGVGVRVT